MLLTTEDLEMCPEDFNKNYAGLLSQAQLVVDDIVTSDFDKYEDCQGDY